MEAVTAFSPAKPTDRRAHNILNYTLWFASASKRELRIPLRRESEEKSKDLKDELRSGEEV